MPKLNAEQVQAQFARMKRHIRNLEAENESLREQLIEARNQPATTKPKRVQTTQQTGKFWKLLLLIGGVGSIAGLFLFSYGLSEERQALTAVGAVIGVGSFLTYAAGRFGKFWFHE